MSTRIFGSGIRRREDPRLITGTATYTDDLTLPRMVYAAMLRSPHAHARITSIDTSKAAAAAGVVAVYTHADTDCYIYSGTAHGHTYTHADTDCYTHGNCHPNPDYHSSRPSCPGVRYLSSCGGADRSEVHRHGWQR